ncbi:MAG: autotransporter protein [Variovorax sp.]|nr:autotransporter protein [Variovorax sp.]
MKTNYASKAALLAAAFICIPAAMPLTASAQSAPDVAYNPPAPAAIAPAPAPSKASVTAPAAGTTLPPVATVNPAPPGTPATPAVVNPAPQVPVKPIMFATPKEVSSALAGTTTRAQAMSHIILGGSHHRPLMSYGGAPGAQNCFWATGDLARSSDSANGGLAEIGVCRDFADGALRAGLGIGTVKQTQDLDNGGSSKLTGNHLVGELNYKTPAGLLLSAVGVFADWDTDLKRGYASTTGAGYSTGTTGVKSTSLRLRADWVDAWNIGQSALTPYAAVTTSRTRTGGYTETGGSAPGTFDGQKYSTTEARFGIASTFALTGPSKVRASLEAAHRFNGNGPTVSGQVPGQFAFSETAATSKRSWVRAGLDLDMPLSRTVLLSFSVHAATKGDDPRLAGSVSLRAAF